MLQKIVNFTLTKKIYHYRNRHNTLSIESLKNELSTFPCNEIYFSITDTSKHAPEVKWSVFIFGFPIRVYKVLKARTPVLPRTSTYFFYKKKKVRFLKKLKTISEM
jgi:hypothetical protein